MSDSRKIDIVHLSELKRFRYVDISKKRVEVAKNNSPTSYSRETQRVKELDKQSKEALHKSGEIDLREP